MFGGNENFSGDWKADVRIASKTAGIIGSLSNVRRQTKLVKLPHSLVAEYFNVTDVYRSALVVKVFRNRQTKSHLYFNSNRFRFRNCRESKSNIHEKDCRALLD